MSDSGIPLKAANAADSVLRVAPVTVRLRTAAESAEPAEVELAVGAVVALGVTPEELGVTPEELGATAAGLVV
jgi:hypothetical protein